MSKYTVRRYFNGEPRDDVSTHRTLEAAVEKAGKMFRTGSEGWQAKVVCPADEDVDYTARDSRERPVNLTH